VAVLTSEMQPGPGDGVANGSSGDVLD